MDELTQSNSHGAVILTTENMLMDRCFGDSSASNSPTKVVLSAHDSPSPAFSPSSLCAVNPASSLVKNFNYTVDDNNHTGSPTASMLLMETPNSVLRDPTEAVIRNESESPCLNKLDFYAGVQEAVHVKCSVSRSNSLHSMYTQACSTPPPMLPSPLDKRLTKDCDDAPRDTFLTSPQKSPAFSGSTYTSHEIVSEIPEFSSSLLHAVTLDVASSPPSSSPLQIFSSSPLASSQASEPPDDSQPDKSGYILNEFQIELESVQNETGGICTSPITEDRNQRDHLHFLNDCFDATSSPSHAPCLPVMPLSTNSPYSMEEVTNDDSETLIPMLSTPEPRFFEHASPLTISCPDILMEDQPLGSFLSAPLSSVTTLGVQSLHSAAEHFEPDMLHNANRSAPIQSSLPVSSLEMTPLPQSSPPSKPTLSMDIEDHTSVPAIGFTQEYEHHEEAVSQLCSTVGKRKREREDVDTDSTSSVRDQNAHVPPVAVSVSSTGQITDPSRRLEVGLFVSP